MNASELITFTGASKTFQIEQRKTAGPQPGSTTISQAVIELWRTGP
jgi:hypothetical protein